MTRGLKSLLIALLLIAGLFFPYRTSRAQSPVVYAVLFYSPTCPHCEYVITEVLPPLLEKYGDQLQIIGVNVQEPEGSTLFRSAVQSFGLDRAGVPFLVVGHRYLMGSADIPEQFPGLIEQYLAQGGADWPAIPGLAELLAASQASEEQSPTPSQVVPAVLFYRSSCSHCQKIVEDVLTPLMEKYGSRLQVFGVDVSSPEGDAIYDAAIEKYEITRFGVPTILVGEYALVGSEEIPERIPGIIETYASQGGVSWPDLPGLSEMMATAQAAATPDPSLSQAAPVAGGFIQPSDTALFESRSNGWRANFALDPVGNSISVIVLAGMVSAVLWGLVSFRRSTRLAPAMPGWVFPALCTAGLIMAGYLAYVETAQATAVCGPVGDCNAVQQSDYARLFGIPIGVLGLAGYIMLLLTWTVHRYGRGKWADYAALGMLVMTTGGILFSIYLTFLEPFVIGATCTWCITSAVIMTLLFLLSLDPGRQALSSLSSSARRSPRSTRAA